MRQSVSGEVRSTSVSGNNPGSQLFPGSANSRPEQVQQRKLLDYLVGEYDQRRWNFQPKRFRSLEIDHQFKLGRLFHGKIGRFGTFEDAVHVEGGSPK